MFPYVQHDQFVPPSFFRAKYVLWVTQGKLSFLDQHLAFIAISGFAQHPGSNLIAFPGRFLGDQNGNESIAHHSRSGRNSPSTETRP